MANQDWAFGMQPVHHIGGGAPVIKRYPLKHAITPTDPYDTKIYNGMVVKWHDDSYVVASTKGDTNLANVLGVSAEYYAGSAVTPKDKDTWPDQNGYIGVYDAAEHIFRIQSDNADTAGETLDAYIQKNVIIATGTTTLGNNDSGIGIAELDGDAATAADKLLRIIGVDLDVKNNDITKANVNLLVRFNFGHIYTQDATIT
jgi:hypothetical protein